MKFRNPFVGTAVLMALASFDASADDLTIPNAFQPGTPARASDVNQNFAAVETAVDDNASDIDRNANNVAENEADIAINADAIKLNEEEIQKNTSQISALVAGSGVQVFANGISIGRLLHLSLESDRLTLMSDTGYIYESSVTGEAGLSSHLPSLQNLYYAGTGCSGTLYIRPYWGESWVGQAAGFVQRSPNLPTSSSPDVYYVRRNSNYLAGDVNYNSRFDGTTCTNETGPVNGFEAFPNDEGVTGVPNERAAPLYTIGMP